MKVWWKLCWKPFLAQFNEWKCYWLNQKLNFGRWDSLSVCVCVCGRQRWCLSCVETRNNNRMYYRFYLRGRFCIYKMKCRQKLFIEILTILSLSLSLLLSLLIVRLGLNLPIMNYWKCRKLFKSIQIYITAWGLIACLTALCYEGEFEKKKKK